LHNSKYEFKINEKIPTLEKNDEELIFQVLQFHPRAADKLKNFARIKIGLSPFDTHSSRCFYLERTTGELEDISYIKCVNKILADFYSNQAFFLLNEQETNCLNSILSCLVLLFKNNTLSLDQFISSCKEHCPSKSAPDAFHTFYLKFLLNLALVAFFSSFRITFRKNLLFTVLFSKSF